jgi:hypothetical protein
MGMPMPGMPMPGMPMPKRPEVDTDLERVVEAPEMVQRVARRSVFARRPTATSMIRPNLNEA